MSALCGIKYADVAVRAERWDASPDFDNSWEEIDELPFLPIEGGGPLRLEGFDRTDGDGIDLDGLGSSRVRVMANGRHNYKVDDLAEGLPREQWLLQFFPVDGPPRPLAGAPRRLQDEFLRPTSGWQSALGYWIPTGWYAQLFSSPGFSAVHSALQGAGHGITLNELAEGAVRNLRRGPKGEPARSGDPLDAEVGKPIHGMDQLSVIAGTSTGTIRESIDAMRKIGLLLMLTRDGQELFIPNPDPGFVWDRAALTKDEVVKVRTQIGYRNFSAIADDVKNALDWAGDDGLRTTIRKLALRLSTSVWEVRGGLDHLTFTNVLTSPWFDTESQLGDDDVELFLSNTRG